MAKAIALVLGSQGAELGSAFAVTDEYTLTARHCLTDSATRQRITEPKVLLRFEQGTEIVADLCGESQSADIAILRFRNSLPVNLKPLPLLPPTSSHDGASFKAFGYPKQRPSPNYSAIHGEIVDGDLVAWVFPGIAAFR